MNDESMLTKLAKAYNAQQTARRKINGAFQRLLENEINIGQGVRGRASVSQQHLREFLVGENGRDAEFPRILQNTDADFIGGSFDRHVKIWPLDDIDVFFPIDGVQLVYSEGGLTSRFHVRTDNSSKPNPLLSDDSRWTDGSGCISSKKLLKGFYEVLNRHYPNKTKVTIDGQAVNAQFSIDSTNNSDGLGFDVVPCFSLFDPSGADRDFYLIPDGNDGWMQTNPKIDREVSSHLRNAFDGMYRPAVKLVKYWSTYRFNSKLGSYYIELAISRALMTHNQFGGKLLTLSDAVRFAFDAVSKAANEGDQQSWVTKAPAVEVGGVTNAELGNLEAVSLLAARAVNFEQQGDHENAAACWQVIFGKEFSIND
ncbi:hypothetical protein SH139x_001909 [Planctomycetaceae bacterium SH139]